MHARLVLVALLYIGCQSPGHSLQVGFSSATVAGGDRLTGIWSSGTGEVVAVGLLPSGTSSVVYVSHDDGASFARELLPYVLTSVWGDGRGMVLVGGPAGLFRSTDRGATFASVPPVSSTGIVAITGDGAGRVLAVAGCDLCSSFTVAVSRDGGATWSASPQTLAQEYVAIGGARFIGA